MKPIQDFKNSKIRVVFTDIDGTLTLNGRLPSESYQSLWRLHESGFYVIPVTGRPAGWCELIARLWPVHGVVGENGAFYFSLQDGHMKRRFALPQEERRSARERLRGLKSKILTRVPNAKVSSDQFCRQFDLAIDFAEDVAPLEPGEVDEIVNVFESEGAHAKVSNIHVNGWFGDFDKRTTCQKYLSNEFNYSHDEALRFAAFIGDSPNDEPMFEYFPNSFAVANIREFADRIRHKPKYVASLKEGLGFQEIAERLIALQIR